MSCQHGNPVDGCDLCDEIDAAWNRGYAAATPTPQAQAGDFPPEQELTLAELTGEAERIAANMEKDGRYLARTVMRELARRLTLPQAPARDAGAVAWLSADGRVITDAVRSRMLNDGPASAHAVREFDQPLTHPAAASDDAIRALVAKWREPTLQDECTLYTMGLRTGRNVCADALEAALSSPDGLRKGE